MAEVNVNIHGRTYKIACENGQESYLTDLSTRLDEVINYLRKTFGDIGERRLTVMAAIMVMDENFETEGKLEKAREELKLLYQNYDKLAERLNTIADRLEHTLTGLNSNELNS